MNTKKYVKQHFFLKNIKKQRKLCETKVWHGYCMIKGDDSIKEGITLLA